MNTILNLISRKKRLFQEDILEKTLEINDKVANHSFLIVGGAGSIGSTVTRELFQRNALRLHVVDLNENNLAELVRDIRSSYGYSTKDFKTFCLDTGSVEFYAFFKSQPRYDYVLNFSALKHVRSEKDPFTLMRMVDVNILNAKNLMEYAHLSGSKKYFCVSTDKASNPANMMGASKRIMELFLMQASESIPVSSARFANVAFSDGSLLYGFNKRIEKKQPISAPQDVKRYFITEEEAAQLCLLGLLFSNNREIFFPKLENNLFPISFADIATKYLQHVGYEPYICATEEEARQRVGELATKGKWPCYFFASDTTGEKDIEEFYTEHETPYWDRFVDIGILLCEKDWTKDSLDHFESVIQAFKDSCSWTKLDLIYLFKKVLPNFSHVELNKYLDDKM